jgi:restriction endonuclease S subunit
MRFLTASLGELGELFQGLAVKPEKTLGQQFYKLINIGDLTGLELRGEIINPVSLVIPDKWKDKHELRPNDILITTRTRPLRASVVHDELRPAIAGQNLGVLRLKTNIADPLYIAGLLTSEYGQSLTTPILNMSSTIPIISLANLKDLEIPLPALEEQHQLARLMLQFEAYEKFSKQALAAKHDILENVLYTLITGKNRAALKG